MERALEGLDLVQRLPMQSWFWITIACSTSCRTSSRRGIQHNGPANRRDLKGVVETITLRA